jgi:hypothetical protein
VDQQLDMPAGRDAAELPDPVVLLPDGAADGEPLAAFAPLPEVPDPEVAEPDEAEPELLAERSRTEFDA